MSKDECCIERKIYLFLLIGTFIIAGIPNASAFDTLSCCDLNSFNWFEQWWGYDDAASHGATEACNDMGYWDVYGHDDRYLDITIHDYEFYQMSLPDNHLDMFHYIGHSNQNCLNGDICQDQIYEMHAETNFATGYSNYGTFLGSCIILNGCDTGKGDTQMNRYRTTQKAFFVFGWDGTINPFSADQFVSAYFEKLNDDHIDYEEAMDYAISQIYSGYPAYKWKWWNTGGIATKDIVPHDNYWAGLDSYDIETTEDFYGPVYTQLYNPGFYDAGVCYNFNIERKTGTTSTIKLRFYAYTGTGSNPYPLTFLGRYPSSGYYEIYESPIEGTDYDNHVALYFDSNQITGGQFYIQTYIDDNAHDIDYASYEAIMYGME